MFGLGLGKGAGLGLFVGASVFATAKTDLIDEIYQKN
jgi:hypothetical protein